MLDYAYILSAGWGTRLRPLTLLRPKVLMPVGKKTLLELWLSKLASFSKVFVNLHALNPILSEYLKVISHQYPFLSPIYESKILGSGGSLFRISSNYPDRWILAINGDSFLSSPLDGILEKIILKEPSIYLVLKDEPTFNNVLVDSEGYVKRIRRTTLKEDELSKGYRLLAYVGIQIFHSSLMYHYGLISMKGINNVLKGIPYMDVMDIYSLMIERGIPIRYIELSDVTWFDVGTVDRYLRLCRVLSKDSLLGRNTILESKAFVKSSVLWDSVRVKAGSSLDTCIVTDGVVVDGNHYREIITPERVWKF
ncbi:MAG: NDP-sugar synthase [Syntrophobacterales bacterium]|nr:NDP-sugar synthase [Syntrophobacterales bacterium]